MSVSNSLYGCFHTHKSHEINRLSPFSTDAQSHVGARVGLMLSLGKAYSGFPIISLVCSCSHTDHTICSRGD